MKFVPLRLPQSESALAGAIEYQNRLWKLIAMGFTEEDALRLFEHATRLFIDHDTVIRHAALSYCAIDSHECGRHIDAMRHLIEGHDYGDPWS